jgi:hypothetical protein
MEQFPPAWKSQLPEEPEEPLPPPQESNNNATDISKSANGATLPLGELFDSQLFAIYGVSSGSPVAQRSSACPSQAPE